MTERADKQAKQQADASRSQKEQVPDNVSGLGSFYAMQRAIQQPDPDILSPDTVLQLQRILGNRYVSRLVRSTQTVESHQITKPIQAPVSSLFAAIQRGKDYWYGKEVKKGEYKSEKTMAMIAGKKMTPDLESRLSKLKSGDLMTIQCHGKYNPNTKKARNLVMWGRENDLTGKELAFELFNNGLSNAVGQEFTLDLFSCFTAGTYEEWMGTAKGKFDITKTVGYQVASWLGDRGYAGVTVKGYIGQSKIFSKDFKTKFGAGIDLGNPPKRNPEMGWHVDFLVGDGDVKIMLGSETVNTKEGQNL